MVKIIQDFIPKGRRNRPGHALTPRYLTIHSTANTQTGANAAAHARYLKGSTAAGLPVSWHFTVDDKVIYQHLPLDENGWHAGDGSGGAGNRQSIGIEICENRDGNQTTAIRNVAWLTAKLMRDFSLKIDRVMQHYDWNRKNCPRILRSGNGWQNFLGQVNNYIRQTAASGHVINIRVNNQPTSVNGELRGTSTEAIVKDVMEKAINSVVPLNAVVTGHGDYINIQIPDLPDVEGEKKRMAEAVMLLRDALKLLT